MHVKVFLTRHNFDTPQASLILSGYLLFAKHFIARIITAVFYRVETIFKRIGPTDSKTSKMIVF